MSMSSLGDTPVSHSASPGNEKVKTTPATSGPTSEMPLASYDPGTHCWRTYAVTSLWGDSPSLATLPPSGMTQNGALFQRPRWEPIIDATGLSSWATPTAVEWKGRGPNSQQQGLAEQVRKWPTPTTRDHKDGTKPRIRDRKVQTDTLGRAVQFWPTPTAVTRPMEGNVRLYRAKIEAGEMTEAEAEAILGKSVWEAQGKIPAVFPTPTYGKLAGGTGGMNQIEALYSEGKISAEERRAMRAGNGGKLNPRWVEWLMGFPLGWTDLEVSETQ